MTQPVGSVLTDGVETLHLSGTEPATLTKVEATGTRNLKVVGVALVRSGRKVGTIEQMDGWPPRDRDPTYRQTFPARLAVCTSVSFERGGDCALPDDR